MPNCRSYLYSGFVDHPALLHSEHSLSSIDFSALPLNCFVNRTQSHRLAAMSGEKAEIARIRQAEEVQLQRPEKVVERADKGEDSAGKSTWKHVEKSPQPANILREPYWDDNSPDVIGRNRNLDPSGEEAVKRRPGCMKRSRLHYKRHWKLYTVLTILFLAIALPIL